MNECVGAPTNKREALVDKTTNYERRGRVCVCVYTGVPVYGLGLYAAEDRKG